MTIAVKDTSLMKKFPEQFAQRMARFQGGGQGGRGGGVRPPQRTNNNSRNKEGNKSSDNKTDRQGRNSAGQRPRGQGGRNGAGGGRRRGGFDINRMIERFPTIKVSDLKSGDMIAVSSPKGKDPKRLTAIKLLAGVEPFVTMAQLMSSRRGGRRGGSGSLSIPGLDSVQF